MNQEFIDPMDDSNTITLNVPDYAALNNEIKEKLNKLRRETNTKLLQDFNKYIYDRMPISGDLDIYIEAFLDEREKK